jgi:hypothetical protein
MTRKKAKSPFDGRPGKSRSATKIEVKLPDPPSTLTNQRGWIEEKILKDHSGIFVISIHC